MKHEIQKLIDELKVREKRHAELWRKENNHTWHKGFYFSATQECLFFIQKLTLLLNAKAGTNGQEDTKNDGNAM